jgi:hypothetical protein
MRDAQVMPVSDLIVQGDRHMRVSHFFQIWDTRKEARPLPVSDAPLGASPLKFSYEVLWGLVFDQTSRNCWQLLRSPNIAFVSIRRLEILPCVVEVTDMCTMYNFENFLLTHFDLIFNRCEESTGAVKLQICFLLVFILLIVESPWRDYIALLHLWGMSFKSPN